MKVGILTYHRAENYGALLQAYALKTYLEQEYYSVELIDYWPQYHENYFKIFSIATLKSLPFRGKLVYIIHTIFSLGWLIRRKRNFKRFMYKYLSIPKKIKYRSSDTCSDYDLVVYGSDQIWRKQNLPGWCGYDPWYYGSNNIQTLKKITYAASMGVLNLTEEDCLFVSKMLDNFSYLSVRENDLQKLLLSLNKKSVLVLDPVFLLNEMDWKRITRTIKSSTQKYILLYNLLSTKESVQLAEEIGNLYGYEIKEIYKGKDWKHRGKRYVKSAGVEDFLVLIRDAEFVISNSFHGVAFSILFEKFFFAVGMRDKAERVLTLLNALGLENRYIHSVDKLNLEPMTIDYCEVKKSLLSLQSASRAFLLNSLAQFSYES